MEHCPSDFDDLEIPLFDSALDELHFPSFLFKDVEASACLSGSSSSKFEADDLRDLLPRLSPDWASQGFPLLVDEFSELSDLDEAPGLEQFTHGLPPAFLGLLADNDAYTVASILDSDAMEGTVEATAGNSELGALSITVPYPPADVADERPTVPPPSLPTASDLQVPRHGSSKNTFEEINDDAWLWSGWRSDGEVEHAGAKNQLSSEVPVGTGLRKDVPVRKDASLEWIKKFEEGGPIVSQSGDVTIVCCSCEVLRRVIHSNGVYDTKLEFHFSHSRSCHAVLHTRKSSDNGRLAILEQQVEELPPGDAEYSIAQFLARYSLLRQAEAFVLCYDSRASGAEPCSRGSSEPRGQTAGPGILRRCLQPLSSERANSAGQFYGISELSGRTTVCNSETSELQRRDSWGSVGTAAQPPLSVNKPLAKSGAAEQRERTSKLRVADLATHFHLPINLAAKELGICPTVLKKICRRNNMRRWPHRKIKSIERIIATLEQTLAEGVTSGEEAIRTEIAQLRQEREHLCAGLLGDL